MNAVEKRSDGFYSCLPEEIVQDILSRLPVKSLKRFESACTSWSFLFRTRYFINKHLSHTRKTQCLLLHHPSSEDRDDSGDVVNVYCIDKESLVLEPAPYFFSPYFKIKGSDNGILCLFQNTSFHTQPVFLLWNPALGQTRLLPQCTKCLRFDEGYFFGCRFHLTSFGCDSISNDYKVVLLHFGYREDFSSEAFACEVYSCVAHSWSTTCVSVLKNLVLFNQSSISLSGRLYWIGNELDDDKLESLGIVLAFDLNRNAFEKIGMPDPVYVNDWKKLCVYKENSLALFCVRNSVLGNLVDLWVARDGLFCTEEPRPHWTLLFTIEEPRPFSPGREGFLYPFAMWGDEIVFNADPCDAFLLINRKTHHKKKIPTFVITGEDLLGAFDYIESLVPVSMDLKEEINDSGMHICDLFT